MVIFTYIANLTNIHLLWKNLTPPKSEIYEEKEHSPASIPTPLPTHFTCYRLEVVAAALEGNLYYGKTKGPRKSRLLPWQPSALLEQWDKVKARKRHIALLFAEILLQDGTFCLTSKMVDFTSFSEVRVNWAYQRKGAERKQKGWGSTVFKSWE